MVAGLERFKEHFVKYADRYVLIGGTASSLVMAEVGADFRSTKDLDRSPTVYRSSVYRYTVHCPQPTVHRCTVPVARLLVSPRR